MIGSQPHDLGGESIDSWIWAANVTDTCEALLGHAERGHALVGLEELRRPEQRGLLMFLAVRGLHLGVHSWAGDSIGTERHGDSSIS